MSGALAIASVTAVLKDLLDNALIDDSLSTGVGGPVVVDTLAPDRIETGQQEKPQLNLFLHHVSPNPGWRNVGLPSRGGNGERLTNPPLALDLHYLLTAYGQHGLEAEILLGYAMQVLHETPVLTRGAIRTALSSPAPVVAGMLPPQLQALAAADLAEQVEQIKLTPQPMNTDEMSKLWTAFQAKYRPSVAYHASVVLIESNRPARSPLPVLTRGENDPATGRDKGVLSRPDLVPPYPTLLKAIPPNRQPAVRMGETLALEGHHLDGVVAARFTPARSSNVLDLPVSEATPTGFRVRVPDPAFNHATVAVANERLLVLPGGNDPEPEITFANAGSDPTAERLLLTTAANTRKATLSGEHSADPEIPSSPKVEVKIGGVTGTANLSFAGVTLPDGVPAADVAPVLQAAIRGASPGAAFTGAIVELVDHRLLVLPGGSDPNARVTFANVGNDPTAERLLLTGADILKATLSGGHSAAPNIPASPRIEVTSRGVTRTADLDFSGVALPGGVPLAVVAPVLRSAIRVALSGDSGSDPDAPDSSQNPDNWRAGVYSVAAAIQGLDQTQPPERTTNELPVALAPRITAISASVTGDGVTFTVKCSPKVWQTQRATLVVGGRELAAARIASEKTGTLIFGPVPVPAGEPRVRLRVDGVESILVNQPDEDGPPVFDDSQKVPIP